MPMVDDRRLLTNRIIRENPKSVAVHDHNFRKKASKYSNLDNLHDMTVAILGTFADAEPRCFGSSQ